MTKKFVIAVFIILVTVQPVKSQTSLDYYRSLFNSWKIRVDVLPQEDTKLDTPATKKDLQTLLQKLDGDDTQQKPAEESIVNTNTEGHYLLLLASQTQTTLQSDNTTFGYQNIIIVCDSLETAPLPQGVSCTSNSINFANQNPSESSVSDGVLQTIQPVKVNGINYYLIPQVLFITPQYQKILGDYFKALSRAQALANVQNNGSAEPGLLKVLKDSSILESAAYIPVVLLFVAALKKPLVVLIRNPKRFFEQDLYINQTHRTLNFLTKNSGVLSLIFLILVLFYIPILYALSTKASLVGDPTYPIKYLTTTLNPLNIPNYLAAPNLFRIGLLFYHYALALFGFFLIVPNLAGVLTRSTQKITAVKLKTGFIKWLIPTTVVLNGLLLAFVDLKSLAVFLLLSVLALSASLFYLKSRQIEYPKLFSAKERRSIILVMLAVLLLNILYPLFQKNQPIKYAYEPLIGIKDEVITLPYSKEWGKNVLFKPYYYSGDSNVYADGYLVYSPNAERIVNKPLDKLGDMENFTIVSRKPDKVFEAVLKSPKLLECLSTVKFSPLFVMDNISSDVFNSPALKVQIIFNCSFVPPPTVVKLETTTLSHHDEPAVDPADTESIKLMNFPGCKTETGLETFEVPLDPYVIPQDPAISQGSSILRIRGIDTKYMSDLKIFAGGKELPIRFINKDVLDESQYKILYSSPSPSKELTNYSAEVKGDFSVDIKTDDWGFNLSAPINELMKSGVLHNPFIIWTDKPNEIIQKYDSN